MGLGALYFGVFVFFFVMGGILGEQIMPHIGNIFIYGGIALGLVVLMIMKFISGLVGKY